jgi:lipoprotein-anchoring transpeptidase ErfK/SrfK
MQSPRLSRRDFLKLSGAALAGLLLPKPPGWPGALSENVAPLDERGRVLTDTLSLYDIPSARGRFQKSYYRDLVLPITGVALNEDTTVYNRIWYRIGEEGFAYSGHIQPVKTLINAPVDAIPLSGILAEVTVPYTDARKTPSVGALVIYRMYYETTYWITDIAYDAEGAAWYKFLDDRDNEYYYAQAAHLRIIPPEELTPLSPEVPPELKRIEVRLSEQLVIAFEDERIVFVTRASTGRKNSWGNYTTPAGKHDTYHKRPTRHMASGNLASNGFDLPGIPWVCYINEAGVSFHGTYWHNDFGTPRSHGCVNLNSQAAKWIYRWTLPVVPPARSVVYKRGAGTQVLVEM